MIMVEKCVSLNSTVEISSFILNSLLVAFIFVVVSLGIYILLDAYNTFIKKS